MSKAFEEISTGLKEAIKHAKGEKNNIIEHTPKKIDVKAIRHKTGMTAQKFCSTLEITPKALQDWEKGIQAPEGTARVLLKILDHNPDMIIKMIMH